MCKYNYFVIDGQNYFSNHYFKRYRFGSTASLGNCFFPFRDFKEFNKFMEKSEIKSYEGVVILWHLSGSDINDEDIKNSINRVKKLLPKAVLKVGKSQDNTFLNLAEDSNWFDFLGNDSTLESEFDKCKWKIDKIIKEGVNFKKKVQKNKTISFILHFFLPLDIDLQALEKVNNPVSYLQNMYCDLEELYTSKEYANKDIKYHYRQKLYDLWYLLDPTDKNKKRTSPDAQNFTPLDNTTSLYTLVDLDIENQEKSIVYKFFESLDTRKMYCNDLTEAVNYLCKPFDIKIENGEKIITFNQWFYNLEAALNMLS